MTLGEIIDEMVRQGYECHVGPHVGLAGYFAAFLDCDHVADNCVECWPTDWKQCGHGLTPLEAVQQARAIILKQPVIAASPDDFRR